MRRKRKKHSSTLVLKRQIMENRESSVGQKKDWTVCILHGILLFVWTAVYIQWMNEALALNIKLSPVLFAAAIFCVFLEAAVRLSCLWQAATGACLLLMLYIWLKKDILMKGLDMIVCQAAAVISEYYHLEPITGNPSISGEGLVPLLIVLAAFLILSVGVTTVKWRLGTVPVILSVLILVASLMVDCFPSVITVSLLMIAGAGLIVLSFSVEPVFDGRPVSRIYVKSCLFTLCMMLVILAVSYLAAEGYVAGKMRSYYDSIKAYPQQMISAVEGMLSGKNGNVSPLEKLQNLTGFNFLDDSGRLTNRAPIQTGTVTLEVDTDRKPEEQIYLKNYTGAYYNTNKEQWESVNDTDLKNIYESWRSSEYWSYDEAKQLLAIQLYHCLKTLSLTPKCSYEITDRGISNCTWVPYGIDSGGLIMEGDSIFQSSSRSIFDGFQMTDGGELAEIFDSTLIDSDVQLLIDEYTAYVRDTYLEIPDGMGALTERYRQLYESYGDVGVSQWIEMIQDDLAESCIYEKYDLENPPEGSNLIDDFYGRQKRGYCIHFASAGVMLLRMAGIPARYVTGYVVWPDDFIYNDETGLYHADITGYRGHAWVEIYDSDSGVWLPVDMTPADSVRDQGQNSQNQSESTKTETENRTQDRDSESSKDGEADESAEDNMDDTEESSETVSGIVNTPETFDGNRSESNRNDDGSIRNQSGGNSEDNQVEHLKDGEAESENDGYFHPASVAAVLILIILCVVYCYIRWSREKRQRFSRSNRNKAVLSMEWHLMETMEKAGWKPEKKLSDWEYAAWVQGKIDTLEEGEYLYFMEKLHQAAYSEEMLTEEEYQKCYATYQKILNKIHQGKKK
ncbi:MAG: transglutaminase domain-containing protein [Coprococcus sp.]